MAKQKIKITPDMAKVGARILADRYDALGDGVDALIAVDVFEAMWNAANQDRAVDAVPSKSPTDLNRVLRLVLAAKNHGTHLLDGLSEADRDMLGDARRIVERLRNSAVQPRYVTMTHA